MARYIAHKAKTLVPCLDAAAGRGLCAPIKRIDNGVILERDGVIEAVGAGIRLPAGCELRDHGSAALLPPLVNCHAHLQLSWLAGKTRWGSGFSAWLRSMMPQILRAVERGFGAAQREALDQACASLRRSGAAFVGDVGGGIPGALRAAKAAAKAQGIGALHFCEWLGFGQAGPSPWPERCRGEVEEDGGACAPCGHALYSTSAEALKAAHAYCRRHGRPFTFHLAESPEEEEMLAQGSGPLADFYRPGVLPDDWRAPGADSLGCACALGLLGPGTLAVHGAQLDGGAITALAESGAALCVCARSNRNLGVGAPRLKEMMQSGLMLCLGTDGLTSCEDLDLRNEARYLLERFDIAPRALLRMATANGAAALMLGEFGLRPGAPAVFSAWEDWPDE